MNNRNHNVLLGDQIESDYSKSFHEEGIPVLVSPLFLRDYGCGQIDFCRIYKKQNGEMIGQLVEVKNGDNLSRKQYLRIKRSLNLLSQILSIPVFFTFEKMDMNM